MNNEDLNIIVDQVNHPSHYTAHPSGIEALQITRHMNFNLGNAMKYIWRAGLKNQDRHIEDLKKAIFYINDEIKRIEMYSGIAKIEDNEPVITEKLAETITEKLAGKYPLLNDDEYKIHKKNHSLDDMYRPDCKYCNTSNRKFK